MKILDCEIGWGTISVIIFAIIISLIINSVQMYYIEKQNTMHESLCSDGEVIKQSLPLQTRYLCNGREFVCGEENCYFVGES